MNPKYPQINPQPIPTWFQRDWHISRLGRWIGSFWYIFVIFLTPDHDTIQTRECHCGQFGASFAPRTPTASPFLPENIFKKTYIFSQTFFRRNPSFTRSPSQAPRRKMTANGFSSYELFTQNIDFSAPARCFVPLLVKTHFFNLLELLDTFTETLHFC